MPFAGLERPAIGLSLLKAGLGRRGVRAEIRYLNWELAERIGLDDYEFVTDWSIVPHQAFVGEWMFTEALYGPRPDMDRRFAARLRDKWGLSDEAIARVFTARGTCTDFIDHCAKNIDWSDYRIVGCTSMFQQNIASIALAKRVKELYPDVVTVMGGANWEGEMGRELHRQFDCVDVVCSGEADESFPAVVAAVLDGRSLAGIAGISFRSDGSSVSSPQPPVFAKLDGLAWPDYDEYFETRAAHPEIAERVPPLLLIQTARGYWWGERRHCTFCGLNGGAMAFRSKSPDSVVNELRHLRERYGVSAIDAVDEILDMKYFRTLLPQLEREGLDVQLFYEIKANITHQQVAQMARGGITSVQPGIENLSDHVLGLMDKGTTALKNVQLLKWCREYGITVYWNLLHGIPGETKEDYDNVVRIIKVIWFLQPPTGGAVRLRLDRFSPYHNDPVRYGVTRVHAAESYHYLYQVDDAALDRIAYYFDFAYTDGRTAPDECAREAAELVERWLADQRRGDLLQQRRPDGRVRLVDTRPGTESVRVLDGWRAAAYLACDRVLSMRRLADLPILADVPEAELESYVDECERDNVMLRDGGQVLSLAVHDPPCPPDGDPTAVTCAIPTDHSHHEAHRYEEIG